MFRPHVEAIFVSGVITIVPLKMIEIWLSTTSLKIEIHLASEVETLQIQSTLGYEFYFWTCSPICKACTLLNRKTVVTDMNDFWKRFTNP